MKKKLAKEIVTQTLKLTLCVLCCFALTQMLTSVIPTFVLCDDLFGKGEEIINSGREKLVKLSMALCPLALILVCVLSMTTHNERKLAWLMNLGKIVLVATALILIIDSDIVIETLQAWLS